MQKSKITKKKATMKLDRQDIQILTGGVSLNTQGYPSMWVGSVLKPIHRIINPSFGTTDHINRDRTDNRRSNLRPCTRSQNMRNRGIQSNNTSKVTGVNWDRASGKWKALITAGGKEHALGYFRDKVDAVDVRREAERDYFGEFAPTNR